jgi:hypothetical protein
VSLHEELCSVDLDCVDARGVFGPSYVDILQASPIAERVPSSTGSGEHQSMEASPVAMYQGINPEWDLAVDSAVTRLASVDMALHNVTRLCHPTGYSGTAEQSEASRDLQRRVRNYLVDNGTASHKERNFDNPQSIGVSNDDLRDLLSDSTDVTADLASRKRLRDDEIPQQCLTTQPTDVGLAAAEAAIAVDQSLRYHVSLSMPRRKHAHSTTERVCICPVFSQTVSSESQLADPSILYLSEVMDQGLATSLERITDFDVRENPIVDLHLKSNQVKEAFLISEAKVRDVRQRPRGAPMHELDRALMESRRKLIGVNLPPELRATSLSDDQVLDLVKETLSLYLGARTTYVALKFLTLHYKRQVMGDLELHGGAVPQQGGNDDNTTSAKSSQFQFRTLDGKLLPNMDAVREAQRLREEHLRFCGVIDQVEDYATIIVVAFLVDPAFVENVSEPTAAGQLGSLLSDARRAKKKVFESPLASSPTGVTLPLGVAVSLAQPAAGDDILLRQTNISKWFLMNSGAINQLRGGLSTRVELSASRDHFELALCVKSIQEFYETVLIERLVRMTRSRLHRLPTAKSYDERVKHIFAHCMSLSPSDQLTTLQRDVWQLQQQQQYSALFLPEVELCIGIEAEDFEEVLDAYQHELATPPRQTLSTGGSSSTKPTFRKPFLPSEHAIVGCLRLLRRLWGSSRSSSGSAQRQPSAALSGPSSSSSPIPVSRLRSMMIAALVSPAEVDELLVEISLISLKDPSVAFEFRRRSYGTDREYIVDENGADACQSEGSGDEDRFGPGSDDDNRGSLVPSAVWSRVNRL